MRRKSLKKSKLMIMSVVEEVVVNDELLIEILLLLPPKSIFKCKCVSKRWNGIIAQPLFLQSYRSKQQHSGAIGRLLAFIQERSMLISSKPVPGSRPFVNILPAVQPDVQKIKPLPDSFGNVIHSSNGLLLCDDYRVREHPRPYRIVNPLTRKWIEVPRAPLGLNGIGLACEENTEELVPSFKVVGIVNSVEKLSLDIHTYSYETRRWTPSTLMANEKLSTPSRLKLVCKGVFHWLTFKNSSIVVYNSNRNENCLHLIKLPEDQSWNNHLTATRSSTDDLLWIGRGYGKWLGGNGVLNFWKLQVDDYDSYKCSTTISKDRWVLMHTINSASLYKEMSLISESKKIRINEIDRGMNRYISVEALIPFNPVAAVLNLQQKMFLYNLESHSLELVQYRGRPYGKTFIARWVPFVESLCLSSYGPLGSTYE